MKAVFVPYPGSETLTWDFNVSTAVITLKSETQTINKWIMVIPGNRTYTEDYNGHKLEIKLLQPIFLALFRKRYVEVYCDGQKIGKWDNKSNPC